jgi:Polysaccharide lyase
LDGVNWLLSARRVIVVSVTAHARVGRFLVLGAGAAGGLVVRRSGCLSPAHHRIACPGGSGTGPIATVPTTTAPTRTTPVAPGTITQAATFEGTVSPLNAQCAPSTSSKSPRLRGTYAFESSIVGQGASAVQITLPTDTDLATFPLEACGLLTAPAPIGLGTDGYYGLMVYVPVGWTIPNSAFFGVNIYELHFQNIYAAPVTLQLHPHHVTLALETGGCANHLTVQPGCRWRSNADVPHGAQPTLPGYYAIPPGALVQGAWNEVVVHVHWSNTSSGEVDTYYRLKGQRGWKQSSSISGIATVQWDNARGCCDPTYTDQLEAYTAGLSSPMSIWLDDAVDGTSLAAVERIMP